MFIKWAKKRGVSYKPIWDGITKNRDPCPHGKQILGTPDQTYVHPLWFRMFRTKSYTLAAWYDLSSSARSNAQPLSSTR